jgi:3-isopropylmalate dehydrogenase
MMLRYSFDLAEDAELIERAVQDVLAAGKRTGDIARPGQAVVSTSQMGDALLAALDKRTD